MKRIAIALAIATCAFAATAQDKPNPLDVVPEKMPNDIPYGTPITLERAQAAMNAAVAEANKRGWKLNVAVVDSGANLVSFARMDGAQLGSIQIAEHKARASVKYRRETKAFEGGVQGGNLYLLSLDDVIASRGGIPLMDAGRMVGAIGCSGGTGSQDEVVCRAGAEAVKR
jgi:uncharacterized protein GlcG (DUF336 family)